MVQEGALTALASVADSSQVLYRLKFQLAPHCQLLEHWPDFAYYLFDRSNSRSITML